MVMEPVFPETLLISDKRPGDLSGLIYTRYINMSLENDIEYYKNGNMSNETLILKYGNRCSGKEYKEQTTMNEKPYFTFEELSQGDFFTIQNLTYKPDEEAYFLKISDRLYFSFIDKKLHSSNDIKQDYLLIIMEYEVY